MLGGLALVALFGVLAAVAPPVGGESVWTATLCLVGYLGFSVIATLPLLLRRRASARWEVSA